MAFILAVRNAIIHPCILTGVFYEEPNLGRYESDEDLLKAFDKAL